MCILPVAAFGSLHCDGESKPAYISSIFTCTLLNIVYNFGSGKVKVEIGGESKTFKENWRENGAHC